MSTSLISALNIRIRKRDGRVVPFSSAERITSAVAAAFRAEQGLDRDAALESALMETVSVRLRPEGRGAVVIGMSAAERIHVDVTTRADQVTPKSTPN